MTMKTDFLLIGGGIASAIAAETLRKEGATGNIIIISAENILPYHRPPLSKKYILGKRKIEQLLVFDESFYIQNDIDVLLNTKALGVDPENKIVRTDHAGDIHFKQLLIATGCLSEKIDIPGSDLTGIYYLNTIIDADMIIQAMKGAERAVILGKSFIGIELASAFIKSGIKVTVITKDYNLSNLDLSNEIVTFLENHGVEVILNETINQFNGKQHVQSVQTVSGKIYPCDFVVVMEDLKPETDFLHGSGIEIDDGIVVNQYLQTNKSDIYAAGDVTHYFDPIFGRYRKRGHWDTAIKQGKIAACNMLGLRHVNRSASYFFFSSFDNSFVIIGDATDANEKIIRGSVEDKSFAILYFKDDLLRAAFFLGRSTEEIKAAESLIINHVNLNPYKKKLIDNTFPLEALATQTVLTLQGGGALGAFECGVVKAMEEYGIYPDIVGGISIGAFNSAIIAANPKNATKALEAFWDELSLDTVDVPDEQLRRLLSSWQSVIFGNQKFFYPKWLMPIQDTDQFPIDWTCFYDPSHIKDLLCKYVDFDKLKKSPVRLLIMAVNVETAEFEAFDSYTDNITPDHILASGSLPPGFPWTTINGKHYWDGGIVTNTPLDLTLEICGSTGKNIYVVELYPRKRPLPKNMIEVLARKDEILFSEKIRKDMRTRDLINNYKKLIEGILNFCEPDLVQVIKQVPLFIQTMGDPGVLSITRIIRHVNKDEDYSWDSDFSRKTITQLKDNGYKTAKKILKKEDVHK